MSLLLTPPLSTTHAASSGGGSIYITESSHSNISLTNSSFINNIANFCGALLVDETYQYSINLTGITFTQNRAIGPSAGNNEGGAMCLRNASILIVDSNFNKNSAKGDSGAIKIEESDVTIKGSIFSNNFAGGDGGAFHTLVYPSTYSVSLTTFTNNMAGGSGGAIYVGTANSQVIIDQSTFSFNKAPSRGGAISVAGNTLKLTQSSIYSNTAKYGGVASACKSSVYITNPKVKSYPDPMYPDCTLYDSTNTTVRI